MAAQPLAMGPVFPPVRGAHGDTPNVTSVRGRGGPADQPNVGSGRWAADLVGATYRQIDYWGRKGFLGEHHQDLGYGKRRHFDDADLEVAAALMALASLGALGDWLALAATTVRTERVRPGEWLLVTIAGHTLRCNAADLPRIVTRGADHAAWLVPLVAFDQGRRL